MLAERHGYSPSLDDTRSRAPSQSEALEIQASEVPSKCQVHVRATRLNGQLQLQVALHARRLLRRVTRSDNHDNPRDAFGPSAGTK
jgi:hypothetical protein